MLKYKSKAHRIAVMASINGNNGERFNKGDYVTSQSMNGRVARIEKFIVEKDRPNDPRAVVIPTFAHGGTAKTLPVDFLDHVVKGGKPNKYGYVNHKDGRSNLKFDKESKNIIIENRQKYIQNRKELISKYLGKSVSFQFPADSWGNKTKTVYAKVLDVEPDHGGMLSGSKLYLKVRAKDGSIYTPTSDKIRIVKL